MTPPLIAGLSTTVFEYNIGIASTLINQKADTWAGCMFLMLTVSLSFLNIILPVSYANQGNNWMAFWIAVLLLIVLGFGVYKISKWKSAKEFQTVKNILAASVK